MGNCQTLSYSPQYSYSQYHYNMIIMVWLDPLVETLYFSLTSSHSHTSPPFLLPAPLHHHICCPVINLPPLPLSHCDYPTLPFRLFFYLPTRLSATLSVTLYMSLCISMSFYLYPSIYNSFLSACNFRHSFNIQMLTNV